MNRRKDIIKLLKFYRNINLFQPITVNFIKFNPNYPNNPYKNNIFTMFDIDITEDIPTGKKNEYDENEDNDKEYEIVVGNIKNKDLYIINNGNKIESVESDNGQSFLFYLKLDNNLKYQDNSFQISKFVYLMGFAEKCFRLQNEEVEKLIADFNEKMNEFCLKEEKFTFEIIRQIKDKVLNKLNGLNYKIRNLSLSVMINKRKADVENQPSIMQLDFYSTELDMLIDNISKVENHFISDLLLPPDKNEHRRIDNDIEFLRYITNPEFMIDVKWPSKHNPSLMQEVAINISAMKGCPKVFSVNGPPGTGKTTLLKEIIADTIYKKAVLISEKGINGLKGKRLETGSSNNYIKSYYEVPKELAELSIIVASNNNAAVENISVDLPKAEDVKYSETLTGLFDIYKNDDDIYFTKAANELFKDTGNFKCFGLISAPYGKSDNIKKILEILPEQLDSDFKKLVDVSLPSFDEIKTKFDQARLKVNSTKQNLIKLSKNIQEIENLKQELNRLKELQIDEFDEKIQQKKIEINLLKQEKTALELSKNAIKTIVSIISGERYKRILDLNQKIKKLENEKDNLEKNLLIIKNKKNHLIKIQENINNLYFKIQQIKYDLEIEEDDDECTKVYSKKFEDNLGKEYSQTMCPWGIKKFNIEREELFYWSIKLVESYILNSKWIFQNLKRFSLIKSGGENDYTKEEIRDIEKNGILTLNILIPVLSTTFASVSRAFSSLDIAELGTIVIDEAGQATPLATLGLLYRARRAIVVGDPLQVEPVMPTPSSIIRHFYNSLNFSNSEQLNREFKVGNEILFYSLSKMSIQVLADALNPYYGQLGDTKVGCPLLVHRRCLDPMFSISNKISYSNRMVLATFPKNGKFALEKSEFIDVKGKEKGNKNHYVDAQGTKVFELIDKARGGVYPLFNPDFDMQHKNQFPFGKKDLFIISPFTSVVKDLKYKCKKKGYPENWINSNIGTVHTFQGKEADSVILVLGCDETTKGAIAWANSSPNILNVAVTRAKNRFVMIGDKKIWEKMDNFKIAIDILTKFNKIYD